jgi:HSP20 family protein
MRIKMSASEVHRCASPPDEIKTVFDNFFSSQRPLFSLSERIWNPPTDVYETSESMVIKMEVAGVKQEDMDISVDNNLLLIRGRRLEETPLRKENFYLMEIRYGCFERVFAMPAGLSLTDIIAEYRDGFLRLTIPKSKKRTEGVKIKIELEP